MRSIIFGIITGIVYAGLSALMFYGLSYLFVYLVNATAYIEPSFPAIAWFICLGGYCSFSRGRRSYSGRIHAVMLSIFAILLIFFGVGSAFTFDVGSPLGLISAPIVLLLYVLNGQGQKKPALFYLLPWILLIQASIFTSAIRYISMQSVLSVMSIVTTIACGASLAFIIKNDGFYYSWAYENR